MNRFDALFRQVAEEEPLEELEKLAASITSLDIEDITHTSSAKRQGEAFAEGFIEALKRHGISPSDASTILKLASDHVPEIGAGSTQPNVAEQSDAVASKHVDPTVQNPSDVDEEPKPNPTKNVPMTDTFEEDDLNKLVQTLGTSQDPVKAQGGTASGPVKIDPSKEVAKKIVEVANGLIAQGVDKDVAIEAAKAAVTAPESEVSREVAKQVAQKTEAAADIDEAMDALEEAVVGPINEAAGAATPEEEQVPEELAKAAAEILSEQQNAIDPVLLALLATLYGVPPTGVPVDQLLKEAALMEMLGIDPFGLYVDPYIDYLW